MVHGVPAGLFTAPERASECGRDSERERMAEPGAQQHMQDIEEDADAACPMATPPTRMSTAMQVAGCDAAATHEKSLTIYAPLKRSLKPKNGFAFVYNVKQVSSRNAQQVTVTCVCCNQSFSSTGSSNIVTHLISCPVCPREIRDGFKELRNASGSKSAAKRKAVVLFTRARPSSRSPRPPAPSSSRLQTRQRRQWEWMRSSWIGRAAPSCSCEGGNFEPGGERLERVSRRRTGSGGQLRVLKK